MYFFFVDRTQRLCRDVLQLKMICICRVGTKFLKIGSDIIHPWFSSGLWTSASSFTARSWASRVGLNSRRDVLNVTSDQEVTTHTLAVTEATSNGEQHPHLHQQQMISVELDKETLHEFDVRLFVKDGRCRGDVLRVTSVDENEAEVSSLCY